MFVSQYLVQYFKSHRYKFSIFILGKRCIKETTEKLGKWIPPKDLVCLYG